MGKGDQASIGAFLYKDDKHLSNTIVANIAKSRVFIVRWPAILDPDVMRVPRVLLLVPVRRTEPVVHFLLEWFHHFLWLGEVVLFSTEARLIVEKKATNIQR